jgi:hypothetical protein
MFVYSILLVRWFYVSVASFFFKPRINSSFSDLKDFPTLSEADLARLAPPSFPPEAASQQQLVRMVGETVR